MLTRTIKRRGLQRLAAQRLKEATSLLDAGHWAGAYYLAGYAVECALKARLAKGVQRHDFPDLKALQKAYVHNLQSLLEQADLADELNDRKKTPSQTRINWAVVKDWSEKSRYELGISERQARTLVEAIRSKPNGVMQWLEQHW